MSVAVTELTLIKRNSITMSVFQMLVNPCITDLGFVNSRADRYTCLSAIYIISPDHILEIIVLTNTLCLIVVVSIGS